MQSLDLLANNLANAGTAGFKRDQEFYGLYSSADATSDSNGFTTTVPVIERQWTDFSAGILQVTGNSLDAAINGKGFFVVRGPNGPLYTRNGSFQNLPTGELATAEGYPVLNPNGDPIQIQPGKNVVITPTGDVQQGGVSQGQLAVVNFASTDSLVKTGNACFLNANPKNAPEPAADVAVQQGKLEGSNVPVAEAAMRLVGVMRQFEMLQKAVTVGNEMDTKSLQEVARVSS